MTHQVLERDNSARTEYVLESLFGTTLLGDKLVRFIYIDEAGTSEKEPASIVVGLIVHADDQALKIDDAIAEVLSVVPPRFAPFTFHATDLWSSRKLRDGWEQKDRLAMLCNMMALPRKLNIPIAIGICKREKPGVIVGDMFLTKAQLDHFLAFYHCINAADGFLATTGIGEVATVVAEDVPTLRGLLQLVPSAVRHMADGPAYGLRIRPGVHWTDKGEDPITQIADACAFGLRRYVSGFSEGPLFMQAILGDNPIPDALLDQDCALLVQHRYANNDIVQTS